MHKYTEEEKEFLKNFVPGHSHKEIQSAFNQKFNEQISLNQVKGCIAKYNLNTGRTGRFEKGHVPVNKGKKGYCAKGSEKGWFNKGNLPENTKPIGYERISKDGYIEVKVRMRRGSPNCKSNFEFKHRIIWEKANGPVPEGYVLNFLDGNKKNCKLENLVLLTRRENLQLTRNKLRSSEAELTKTGILIAKNSIAMREAKNKISKKKGTSI